VSPTLRVLWVDDDPMQVELLGRALAYESVEVEGLLSLSEIAGALVRAEADLVLLDHSVLGPEPRASVKVVRAFAKPSTVVVLLSAADEGKLRRVALECDTDGWISKSMPVPEMAKRMRELLARREGSRG
jgi:DNA-binding response OmpR family regulator